MRADDIEKDLDPEEIEKKLNDALNKCPVLALLLLSSLYKDKEVNTYENEGSERQGQPEEG